MAASVEPLLVSTFTSTNRRLAHEGDVLASGVKTVQDTSRGERGPPCRTTCSVRKVADAERQVDARRR